ncbi:MAG: hypothetical protein CM15mP115_03840 [Alphaproteobacteria bacterium]|nr:MAG: hypothetical protein CM15mP115_03840 [Alphaproteobacteria bacterium]
MSDDMVKYPRLTDLERKARRRIPISFSNISMQAPAVILPRMPMKQPIAS